jgi:hypothetical protein
VLPYEIADAVSVCLWHHPEVLFVQHEEHFELITHGPESFDISFAKVRCSTADQVTARVEQLVPIAIAVV